MHSNYKSINIVNEFFSNINCFVNIMNEIFFVMLHLGHFQILLLYLLLTKTHQITQWPGLPTLPYFFFNKIVILFHSSLTLSTIK